MSARCPHRLKLAPPDQPYPEPPPGRMSPFCYPCWKLGDVVELTPADGPGLGDAVAGVLSAVGITPERVTKLIGRPCGCEKRKEKLNQFGRKVGAGVRKLFGRGATRPERP